jgi:hypothetical protein
LPGALHHWLLCAIARESIDGLGSVLTKNPLARDQGARTAWVGASIVESVGLGGLQASASAG